MTSSRDNLSSSPDISTDQRASGRTEKGNRAMELLIPVVFFVAWFVLQAWVLPRFGVQT